MIFSSVQRIFITNSVSNTSISEMVNTGVHQLGPTIRVEHSRAAQIACLVRLTFSS